MSTNLQAESLPTVAAPASSATWFWWKETRQLMPLVLLLFVVAVLIVFLNIVGSSVVGIGRWAVPDELVLLVFPGLLATGAGPLLVGQERATRTLDWLALLPMSINRLVMTKFWVALLGLFVMWVFSALTISFFGLGRSDVTMWEVGRKISFSNNPFSYPVWAAHSVFILLSGFYVSWRIKNQFYSLVALIPLAFAPMLLTSLYAAVTDQRLMSSEVDVYVMWLTLIGIAILAPLTYRAAVAALSPAPAPSVSPQVARPGGRRKAASVSADAPRFGTTFAPLVWQAVNGYRGIWLILIGMFLLTMLDVAAIEVAGRTGNSMSVGLTGQPLATGLLFLAPLACSWLGVCVFKNDGSVDRVRFLADRGISPGKVFLAQHAVPLAILSAALLVYSLWSMHWVDRFRYRQDTLLLPSLLALVLAFGVLYSISQWISQIVRTHVLAVILCPALALVALGWLLFAQMQLGFPLWGFALCALAPLAATRLMMRRYMDSTDQPMTFLVGAGVLVVWIGLPLAYAASYIAETPSMDPTRRAALLEEGRHISTQKSNLVQLTFNRGTDPGEFTRSGLLRTQVERMQLRFESQPSTPDALIGGLSELRDDPSLVAFTGMWEIQLYNRRLSYERLKWIHSQSDPEAAFEGFAPWLEGGALMLGGLRRSVGIGDQFVADVLEVMLVEMLMGEEIQPYRDHPMVQSSIRAIGTPDSRADARRRALLASWYRDINSKHQWEREHLSINDWEPQGLVYWLKERHQESLISAALDGIERSRKPNSDVGWRRELHRLQQPGGVFESSRYGDRMRSLDAATTSFRYGMPEYGDLWGQGWEYVSLDEAQ